jgi:hypothetical protein
MVTILMSGGASLWLNVVKSLGQDHESTVETALYRLCSDANHHGDFGMAKSLDLDQFEHFAYFLR